MLDEIPVAQSEADTFESKAGTGRERGAEVWGSQWYIKKSLLQL